MPNNDVMLAGLQGSWDAAQKPLTTLPSQAAQKVARPITDWGMNHSGVLGGLARGAGAFGESLGDTLSGMTSPLSLGMTLATGGMGGGAVGGAAERGAAEVAPGAIQGLRSALPRAASVAMPSARMMPKIADDLPTMLEHGGPEAYDVAQQGLNAAKSTMTESFPANLARQSTQAAVPRSAAVADEAARDAWALRNGQMKPAMGGR